jgi:glycosyltransferase involved in cell wall biosynthesis
LEKVLSTDFMRIAIIADSFPPLKNSAAVLVFSLAEILADLGHKVLVITPASDIDKGYVEDDYGTFMVLRIHCGKIKSHNQFIRGLNELSLFFTFPYQFKRTHYALNQLDAVIWYSPSIFFGGLVKFLQKKTTYSYLILRDIVPDWMVDIGLMRKGLSYFLLKWFEIYQYGLADFIGVQSAGNRRYIEKLKLPKLKKLEVLPNWMPSISTQFHFSGSQQSSFTNLQHTILAARKVLIYAGNLGEAQGIENFAQVILEMRSQSDCGFLIIGRGSKKEWLQAFIKLHQLDNALILDEVSLPTLSMYYSQCHAGLVFLDSKHQSHNIPGKFISYLEASLPVVACVNPGNDLIKIIIDEKLGLVVNNSREFSTRLAGFLNSISKDAAYGVRARSFYESHYQPSAIAGQILSAFIEQENLDG